MSGVYNSFFFFWLYKDSIHGAVGLGKVAGYMQARFIEHPRCAVVGVGVGVGVVVCIVFVVVAVVVVVVVVVVVWLVASSVPPSACYGIVPPPAPCPPQCKALVVSSALSLAHVHDCMPAGVILRVSTSSLLEFGCGFGCVW
jgi:hypothetical protein